MKVEMDTEPTTAAVGPWPANARFGSSGLDVAGVLAEDLAARYGTPLFVVDEADLRERCRTFAGAFPVAAYAVKAFTSRAVMRIATDEGLGLLVASGGELSACLRAGADASVIAFHGNNKSDQELELAVRSGVGLLIADNVEEILRLERIAAAEGRLQGVAVRVLPGVAGGTHPFVETGGAGSKFGTPIHGGAALHAIRAVLAAEALRFAGLHAHVGSQLLASEPYLDVVDALLDLAKEACDLLGAETGLLDIGGGFGTTYTDEVPADVGRLAAAVLARVRAGAAGRGIQAPNVMVEPGRAIVANPVVTLYRVGAVKRGLRSSVAVDGGMSDNIRPALYGARYMVALAGREVGGPRERERFVVVGKHCESGDVLADDVSLPGDVSPGDLLAVAATGAYCYSMASNYNRLGRPAVVAVAGGRSALWVRRETEEDMDRFDVSGPDYHRNRTLLHEEQR